MNILLLFLIVVSTSLYGMEQGARPPIGLKEIVIQSDDEEQRTPYENSPFLNSEDSKKEEEERLILPKIKTSRSKILKEIRDLCLGFSDRNFQTEWHLIYLFLISEFDGLYEDFKKKLSDKKSKEEKTEKSEKHSDKKLDFKTIQSNINNSILPIVNAQKDEIKSEITKSRNMVVGVVVCGLIVHFVAQECLRYFWF